MTLKGPDADEEWRMVQEQAARFWTSPWAMVSQTNGHGRTSRVFEHHDRLIIEIEVVGIDPRDLEAEIDESHLHVRIKKIRGRYGEDEVIVPLPYRVMPETAQAEAVRGVLRVKVLRRLVPGRRARLGPSKEQRL